MTNKGTGPAGVDDGAEKQTEPGRGSNAVAILDRPCWLCRTGASDNRWSLCDRCLAALFRQLRRRREAAGRMAPLDDGRRDPAGPVTDGRWSA